MDKKEIVERVQNIFRDVLNNDTIILKENDSTDSIKGYDSLTHIQILSEVQESFGIKFTAKEMISWDTVGEMCDTVITKINMKN